MNEINTLLEQNSNILMIAPTGWGKTTLLLELIEQSDKCWIYLAPLRALANEFYVRTSSLGEVVNIKSAKEAKELSRVGLKLKLIIITPELLNTKIIRLFESSSIVVFDEIHLFSYWGDTFRPRLRESFEEVLVSEMSTLSLSATMNESLIQKWKDDCQRNADNNFIINLKNHTLKNDPLRRILVLGAFKKVIWEELKSRKVAFSKLIFCAYKNEVHKLEKELTEEGFSVISVIGGETSTFGLKLQACKQPDYIIGTTAISHGVNLPRISIVYINYPVNNYDFWIQMIGRAGRRDETFEVYTCDSSFLSHFEKLFSFVYLLFIKLKNMIYPYELRRYLNSQN